MVAHIHVAGAWSREDNGSTNKIPSKEHEALSGLALLQGLALDQMDLQHDGVLTGVKQKRKGSHQAPRYRSTILASVDL